MSIEDAAIRGGYIQGQATSCWPGSNTYYYPQPHQRTAEDHAAFRVAYAMTKWLASDADEDAFTALKKAHEEWEALFLA